MSGIGSTFDTVGTLLATVANLVAEGLRILSFADKRHWEQDEHEQQRALEAVLDEAKTDFQELSRLVNGQAQYENDRNYESVSELRALSGRLRTHIDDIKDWARAGGPIDTTWIRETQSLQRDLHRAQCRAARRVFSSEHESSRCLGGFLLYRKQRAWSNGPIGRSESDYQRRHYEELVTCKRIGGFERFGEQDIAFICDFCDGHLVWEDLESVPTALSNESEATATTPTTTPIAPTMNTPQWDTTGATLSEGQPKQVVFAPVAIANHIPPLPLDWQARMFCPFCQEESELPQEKDDEEELYRADNEFEDVAALQEHLEWQHGGGGGAVLDVSPASSGQASSNNTCRIM